jgi:hypothetical protein
VPSQTPGQTTGYYPGSDFGYGYGSYGYGAGSGYGFSGSGYQSPGYWYGN